MKELEKAIIANLLFFTIFLVIPSLLNGLLGID